MKWNSPEFKMLQKAWYERLESEGFRDAEELINGELILKETAAHNYRGLDELRRTNKEAYFHFISQHVEETAFSSAIDHLILLWHAEGKKIVQICRDLDFLGKGRCRRTVRSRIRIYEMRWGIREYTPQQLNRYAGAS